jgi:hypothetical protein
MFRSGEQVVLEAAGQRVTVVEVGGGIRVYAAGDHHLLDGYAVTTCWLDEAYRYLMVTTGDVLRDVARRRLAVEPMTCPPNAFQTGEAVIRLEPGQTFTGNRGITLH